MNVPECPATRGSGWALIEVPFLWISILALSRIGAVLVDSELVDSAYLLWVAFAVF
jgi:hypothetical protein